ncbi:MAG: alpha/beta hydrolase, partial [Candidatus Eremiobacterota bacterium]
PSLVVVGAVDPLIPVTSGIRVARLIPDCRLEILPFGGHVVMWEQARKLNVWLRELVAGTPLALSRTA